MWQRTRAQGSLWRHEKSGVRACVIHLVSYASYGGVVKNVERRCACKESDNL
jgi:hypothetical protein